MSKGRAPFLRYGVSILTVGCALALTLLLRSFLERGILAFFFAAVMTSAWYGGLGPGLVATVLSVLASDYFLIAPKYSLTIHSVDDTAQLVVFSLVAVLISLLNTAQKRGQIALQESNERNKNIVDGALDAVVSIDARGMITDWNPQAEAVFGRSSFEAKGKDLLDLVIPARSRDLYRGDLENYLGGRPATVLNRRHEMTALRRDGAEFPVELALIPLRSGESAAFTAFIRDITDRKRIEAEMKAITAKLEDRVKERTAWLRMVSDITGAANEAETVEQAFRFVLRRISADGRWRYSHVYFPSKDNPEILVPSLFHWAEDEEKLLKLRDAASGIKTRKGQGPAGRVWEGGRVEWVSDVRREPEYSASGAAEAGMMTAMAFPVVAGRQISAVVECFSNASIEEDPNWVALMGAVGVELGLIVDRKLTQEDYVEAVWRQQLQTAQELHDSLGQRLTGLGFLSKTLAQKLKDTAQAKDADRVTEELEKALEQIRNLAKGVFPVDLDSEGLMSALAQLATTMESESGIACRFECPEPVLIEDNRVAMHLYRIAQEAVTNALKHARPHQVLVTLAGTEHGFVLKVSDDGAGIRDDTDRKKGAGLRIMRYRAAAIGATLKIESPAGKGTLVVCQTPQREHGGAGLQEPQVHHDRD
jgi:PAS domain S-box-containing protein